MTTRVVLNEYTTRIIDLTREDLERFDADTRRRIRLTPTQTPGTYEINPNQYVGVIRLQSGLTLDLLPKVPLFNVMWMIAEVERLERVNFERLENDVTITTFEDILEPIAHAFVDEVEHLLDLGLYRAYIEQQENLVTVRGRIDFREDLNRNVILRHRTWCRFNEFSWDVPENQVIRQVVRMLARWGFSTRLSRRLVALDRQMGDISLTQMRANEIQRFHYSRQSEHYRSAHRFCHLFLDGFSLSEGVGKSPFDGFLIDMNMLFEQFVAIKLQKSMNSLNSGVRVNAQHSSDLFMGYSMKIRPDLLLDYDGKAMLAADTKYKKPDGGFGSSADYYQMIAYCTVLGLDHGMLLYPKHMLDIQRQLPVVGTSFTIHEHAIDLRESREAIVDEFLRLARVMLSLRHRFVAA